MRHIHLLIALLLCVTPSILLPAYTPPSSHHHPHSPSFYCAEELRFYVEQMRKIPEIESLLQQVLREGSISFLYPANLSFPFEAYWDGNQRAIIVNRRQHSSSASLYSSLLFELHNAATNRPFFALFAKAKRREIDRHTFVREMERIEHNNALSTVTLLRKGVQQGILPKDAANWTIYTSFEQHFQLQQQQGHSAYLGQLFDQMQYNLS